MVLYPIMTVGERLKNLKLLNNAHISNNEPEWNRKDIL